ncbi:putative pyruvate-flavodoxin oxidoreductase [Listeria floridensis FSL S10-1187]|uniref:Pyruvate-flavodoxin oxidoreductase n=1 Tax=Listeria floridensis FSL S10-1187 TaxID=1265817 RepID=A0ABP3AX33_9LIST|nr:pyruvate:ferredoxin (flavodoxin) oxidoreductase [Listeria floridensis]EUJ30655.1 putative pyruvate-flavodoxin oxidoreductase [Listeria floridensis FSL S10-1187]
MRKRKTMDGNAAAAHISYAFTEVAAIYPITPSSTMAELVDEWSAGGKKNLFGEKVKVVEMQSEAGAAGTVHGSLKAGALTSTYTASQGLLLMIPNMYKIAGELLPTVFHVSARTISAASLNIFGDHSDVMAARQTGFVMLAEGSVQEVMDLSAVAHLASLKGSLPFINFFDGFRTSHELQKIEVLEYSELREMLDPEALEKFRARAMTPNRPTTSGSNQNPDIFFQQRETVNQYYEEIPGIVRDYMNEINLRRGTNYDLVNYYGDPNATDVIVAMGSVTPVIEQVIDTMRQEGKRVGLLNIRLYRPFPADVFLEKMPKTVERVAVLDRTKEPGAGGEPLLLDVQSALYQSETRPSVIGGRYGLGSKDVTPDQILGVYSHLMAENPKQRFTLGIIDDVTHLSIPGVGKKDLTSMDTIQCKFYGFGSDGTVGANKAAIKIIGDKTDLNVQGYFSYDSKKSGGLTISHLRFGQNRIRSAYLIHEPDFVSCSTAAYVNSYDLLSGLKKGGTFLLNTVWEGEQLDRHLPAKMKRYIAENDIQFYTINAIKIANEAGLGRRMNTVMQTAFFKLSKVMDFDEAFNELKEAAIRTYGKKDMRVAEKNIAAMDQTLAFLKKVEVPETWKNVAVEANDETKSDAKPAYVKQILEPMNALKGDELSIGMLIENGMADGSYPQGTAAYEKRGIALEVPEWISENCTMCNECAFVCPHAAIRPILANEEEQEVAPAGFITREMRGKDGLGYRIQVSPMDCTGCNLCAHTCPAKDKALVMKPFDEVVEQESENWDFAMSVSPKKNPGKKNTLPGSQFEQPLLEFSGACAGCGETPYVKLLTQMFGDRMMIANATGCSSIWGASAPATPYTVNHEGHGPAWSNSLLEDNAEYGFGMYLANKTMREALMKEVNAVLLEADLSDNLRHAFDAWKEGFNVGEGTRDRAEDLQLALLAEMNGKEALEQIYEKRDLFIKRSQWMIGGDGWAYDIGFGGIDHVLASGEDVNMLVMDNEVYSNTGGQSSKATPMAAIAKFAASGKRLGKKDLGFMAMSYGNVYVAQVAMGANKKQMIKAFEEAEKFDGPSLIIAYTPCIAHGISAGMKTMLTETDKAVECGYWNLYRYNPDLLEKGKNPMAMDFKKPNFGLFLDFLKRETRFSALYKSNPDVAKEIFEGTRADALRRFKRYAQMAGLDLAKVLPEQNVSVEARAASSDKPKLSEEEKEQRKLARQKARAEKPVDPEREARKKAREERRKAKQNEQEQ